MRRRLDRILVLVVLAIGCTHSGVDDDDGAVAIDSGSSPDTPPPPSEDFGELQVMTWNLERFPLTSTTSSTTVEIIERERPDLVAVQEIADVTAFLGLADSLEDYEAVLPDHPGEFIRVGLLYRTERVVITEPETLFPGQWWEFPRAVLKVRASAWVRPSREPFDFILLVVHLKASEDDESRERRAAACTMLDEWIRSDMTASQELDYIIAGDFNDKLTDWGDHNVFRPFLDHPETYRFLSMDLAEAGAHSFLPFESLIDHIVVTSDALDEYGDGETVALPLEVRIEDYEDRVSDHRPVVARFSLP